MVKIDSNFNQTQTDSTNPQTQPLNQTNSQTATNESSKGLFTLPDSVMKFVPWIPFALEAVTGQKIPSMTGTMADIQTALQQLQLTHTQIINNQNQIYREIEQLKTNANNHLTNLTHQFNSLRLTHTQEKKQIEFNRSQPLERKGVYSEPSLKEQNNEDY